MRAHSSPGPSLREPFALSLGGHLLLIGAVLFAIYAPLGGRRTENVPLEVYENPSPALSPMHAAPPPKPIPRDKPKPRAVFGINRGAVTSNEGIDAKAGNTVAKAPDQEKLRDSDLDKLPIPTEEYLVSKMPELSSDFRVPYPPEAKRQGIQGVVIFDLLIDSEGRVRQAELVEGPGHGLNEAASSGIRNLRFKPAEVDGKPVAVRIRYAYRFVLEK